MKWLARGVALVSGCTSLVAEVLWMRVVGFAESGRAGVFAAVLGTYLVGIALGAYAGRRICYWPATSIPKGLFWLLLGAALFDPLSILVFPGWRRNWADTWRRCRCWSRAPR
ncbi:hypothetical protein H1235_03990 [Pseudoxanthomonas sp. NC8]|nr:hypothetical protein H1235_03990 [Pseudoxanthomonas sp. NC8]